MTWLVPLRAIKLMSASAFDRPLNCSDWISSRSKPPDTISSCRRAYLKSHPTLANLFDTLVSQSFRNEIEALGGYDTRDTGKLHSLRERR